MLLVWAEEEEEENEVVEEVNEEEEEATKRRPRRPEVTQLKISTAATAAPRSSVLRRIRTFEFA